MKNIMIFSLLALSPTFAVAQDQTPAADAKPQTEVSHVIDDPELDPFGGVSHHGTANIDKKTPKEDEKKVPSPAPDVKEP